MTALPGLETRLLGRNWLHFDSLPSTNDYCKENAPTLPDGTAVTASLQTKGKGRLGRGWQQPANSGLALSLLLTSIRPEQMGFLPLLAGMAVCQGLEDLCGVHCGLKWSNDVLLSEKKLCGILCESRVSTGGSAAVVGIGVNMCQSRQELDRLGLVYATSLLEDTGKLFSPEKAAAFILNALEPLLDRYLLEGAPPLLDRYRDLCVTLGKQVMILWQGEQKTATALDIGPDGALLCNVDGKIRAITAGETSVRGLYGYI